MASSSPLAPPRRAAARLLGWRRVLVASIVSLALWSALVLLCPPAIELPFNALAIGFGALLAFGAFERWPRRLPPWLPRWTLQVIGTALAVPLSATLAFSLFALVPNGEHPFWHGGHLIGCFSAMNFAGLLVAPWVALGSLVRQRETFAREQALAFDLERSEFARQTLDARLHLLQAQVAPHFLFNTLANVQALVDAGSPQASGVLRSLVAYLRAAAPRLHEPATTIGSEIDLARAYLELMHLRMPDRLAFSLRADDAALALRCPTTTLLTLVENAVRHGIDPSEDGGRIDVDVQRRGDRCHVSIVDTGVGLHASSGGLGTGLATLRERLRLLFGDAAALRIAAYGAGVRAQIDFPARVAT